MFKLLGMAGSQSWSENHFFLWWVAINIEIYIGNRTVSEKLRVQLRTAQVYCAVPDLMEECGKRQKRYMTQMMMTSAGKFLMCHRYYTQNLTVTVSTLHKELKKITRNSTITGVDDLQPPPQIGELLEVNNCWGQEYLSLVQGYW